MTSRLRKARAGAGVIGVLALAGCASAPDSREPRNLQLAKEEVRAYVAGGGYARDVAAVAAEARTWLERRVTRGGSRLAVVFDVDETLLSNLPSMEMLDFGYIPAEWNRWVEQAKAPALEPVRALFRRARELGVETLVITGRRETERDATARNLAAVGCGDFAVLVCRPDSDRGGAADFKAATRARLAAEGRVIVANIGDQESDLTGGHAERAFKLPGPFYLIR
jgi:phosphoglycolate phosphatase-like HAD superfamily hydrolase